MDRTGTPGSPQWERIRRVARDPLRLSARYRALLRQKAEADLEIKRLRDASSGQGESGLPDRIRAWELLYDPATGGWRCHDPFLENAPFDPELVSDWRMRYEADANYAAVELEVGRFYYWFVRLTRPQYVLETGTNGGYSTSMLAGALMTLGKDVRLVTLDLLRMHHLFDGTDLANVVRFVESDSAVVDPSTLGCPWFDLLVLDSGHHYGCIAQELERFEPLLRVGGHILLHDSLYFDGVGLAVEQLMDNARFEVVTLPTPRTHGREGSRCPGLTIVEKTHEDDGRFPLTVDQSLWDVGVHASPAPHVEGTGTPYLDSVTRRRPFVQAGA